MFRGQLANPMGVTGVERHWQANPVTNQIVLQGMQTNGYQSIPYGVIIQATTITPQYISGISSGGEQVTWQRVSPPPLPPEVPRYPSAPHSRSR